MSTWSELREVLLDLESRDPDPLSQYPDPRDAYREGPLRVTLAAWAESDAAAIYQQFGTRVALTVGTFSYPRLTPAGSSAWRLPAREPAAGAGLVVTLTEPLVIRSGHTLRPEVLVSNRSDTAVLISTNRQLQSFVVDGEDHVVGAYVGAQHAPGQVFDVAAGATVAIPVLVGTASLEPRLGYAIPPGDWHIRVDLDLVDPGPRITTQPAGRRARTLPREYGRRLTSGPLPLTVTA